MICSFNASEGSFLKMINDEELCEVPPGCDDSINLSTSESKLSSMISSFKGASLLGLEYVLEINADDSDSLSESFCYCLLCERRNDMDNIIHHLTSSGHRLKYLAKFFPRAYSYFKSDLVVENWPERTYELLKSITWIIEQSKGRLNSSSISVSCWDMKAINLKCYIEKGVHLRETADLVYVETAPSVPIAADPLDKKDVDKKEVEYGCEAESEHGKGAYRTKEKYSEDLKDQSWDTSSDYSLGNLVICEDEDAADRTPKTKSPIPIDPKEKKNNSGFQLKRRTNGTKDTPPPVEVSKLDKYRKSSQEEQEELVCNRRKSKESSGEDAVAVDAVWEKVVPKPRKPITFKYRSPPRKFSPCVEFLPDAQDPGRMILNTQTKTVNSRDPRLHKSAEVVNPQPSNRPKDDEPSPVIKETVREILSDPASSSRTPGKGDDELPSDPRLTSKSPLYAFIRAEQPTYSAEYVQSIQRIAHVLVEHSNMSHEELQKYLPDERPRQAFEYHGSFSSCFNLEQLQTLVLNFHSLEVSQQKDLVGYLQRLKINNPTLMTELTHSVKGKFMPVKSASDRPLSPLSAKCLQFPNSTNPTNPSNPSMPSPPANKRNCDRSCQSSDKFPAKRNRLL